ncbi:MAG: tRNA preQ1(34) S-adenosylmethionine ribosyltransferase-isomerase QueA [Acidimicrobiia bacterium]
MRVEQFNYLLPDSAIAQEAIEPRHGARLLDTRDMSDHTFLDLADRLRPGDLVVVNETRVRAARLRGHRSGTGGEVELLLLRRREDHSWEALARPARRLRPGVVIELDQMQAIVRTHPVDGVVRVDLVGVDDVEGVIEATGEVPLPPYFKGHLDEVSRYQTMFARTAGSAAAPTAGLHFTTDVVDRLSEAGIAIASVDLHVGIDTFRPIQVDEIEGHRMHREWCSITAETATRIRETRRAGGRVVAIGTTVARTLESFANDDGTVADGRMETDLFLKPGDPFRVVDVLVTNFHVPGSTLIVLVAAFMGERWRLAYQAALDRGYRFLSFGDAMIAERSGAR